MNYQGMNNEVLVNRGRDIIFKWKKSQLWMYHHRDTVTDYEKKYNAKQNQIDILEEILSRIDTTIDGRNQDES